MKLAIDFVPVEPRHFDMLWEWVHRPHVAEWWAFWLPPTRQETIDEWTAMVEGRIAQRAYLVTLDGVEMGYIEGYVLDDEPEMKGPVDLGTTAVAADIYIADPELVGRGIGPEIVRRFYLRLMDETGLDVGIIDPEVDNHRAIRAYEKAGFSFLKVIDSGKPRGRDQIMRVTRDGLERAGRP